MKKFKSYIYLLLVGILFLTGCSEDISLDIEEFGSQEIADEQLVIDENSEYNDLENVVLYIEEYGKLPSNYISKKEAKNLGWISKEGNLWDVAQGKSIGGDYFGNYEEKLPKVEKRKYYECDINYNGGYRGQERLIYSNDGVFYYTNDHYNNFKEIN